MDAFEQAGADYRAAKDAVPAHLRKQAAAELALVDWLRAAPPGVDHSTDPDYQQLLIAVRKAEADVAWCRGLVIACGEVAKGQPFDTVPKDRGRMRTVTEIVEGAD